MIVLDGGDEPGYYRPPVRGIALPQKQLRFVAGIHQAGPHPNPSAVQFGSIEKVGAANFERARILFIEASSSFLFPPTFAPARRGLLLLGRHHSRRGDPGLRLPPILCVPLCHDKVRRGITIAMHDLGTREFEADMDVVRILEGGLGFLIERRLRFRGLLGPFLLGPCAR